jgi:hypothetical protein
MEFDFTKSLEVASLDAVPADFRGLYKQDGDKYKLNSEDPGIKSAVTAIVGLNTALKAARLEAQAAGKKVVDLSPLADFGDSPTAILETFNARLADTKKAKGVEDVEKAVKSAREALQGEHTRVVTALETKVTRLTGQLHSLLIGSAATAALAEANAVDVDLALPHVVKQLKVVENNGDLSVVVLGSDGEPRYSGVTTKHLSIPELVAEMKGNKKYEPLFRSAAPSGGGGQASHRTGGAPAGERSSAQKIADGLARRSR